jgi:two-component system, NarL family, response regulator
VAPNPYKYIYHRNNYFATMKILVYDDHGFVTDAISSFLHSKETVTEVTICNRIIEVKDQLAISLPDVMISDLLTNEEAGLSLLDYVLFKYPTLKIVVYTSISNEFMIDELKEMGIMSVVNKRDSLERLFETVCEVYNHDDSPRTSGAVIHTLTQREKQIVLFLSEGKTYREIAAILGTSPNTINNQKNALLQKFACKNTTDLIVKLGRLGLINVL